MWHECISYIGGKVKRKETIGRPRRKWMDDIEMDVIERQDGMV
jgi:hypothetical protein